jgi:hypothetical protein
MIVDFLDFSGDVEFVLGDLVLDGDELREMLVLVEGSLNLAPGQLDYLSAEEKRELSLASVNALQRCGVLSARFYH